jgi:hypothetical protein
MKNVIFNSLLIIVSSLLIYQTSVYLFNFVNPWLAILLAVSMILIIVKLSDKILNFIFKSKNNQK